MDTSSGIFSPTNAGSSRLKRGLFFLLIVLPGLLIGYFSYVFLRNTLTQNITEKRAAVATLSATVIQEKLTNLTNLGNSYASRPGIQELILAGKWEEVIKMLDEIQKYTPIIDRVIITDTRGNLKADTPPLAADSGRNYSHMEWFKTISRNPTQPYVSRVYIRLAPPRMKVVMVAVPVPDQSGKPIAFMGLQIQEEHFRTLANLNQKGKEENYFIIDQAGQVVHNPLLPTDSIFNYSHLPAVQKVLNGENGAMQVDNPLDGTKKLTAYAPVQDFGWGVLVQQSPNAAFAERDESLNYVLFIYGAVLLLNILFAFLIVRNMYRLSRARKKLMESQERYALAIEGANDGLWDWNVRSNEVYFSARWKSMLGYAEDEFPNNFDAWKAHLHPDDAERATTTIQAYFNKEKPVYELEHRLRHKDGNYRWILARGMALWDEAGNPYRMIGSHTDLTERKRMEEERAKTQNFLNSIVENIPIMLFVKDAKELKFMRLNKAGEELTGLKEKDLVGKTDYDLFPKEQADFFVSQDREVLASGKLADIPEEKIASQNKGERLLHTRKIPVLDRDGKPAFLLGISEDITEAKRAEEKIVHLNRELESKLQQLEKTNQELKDVTHIISHDLKAPLRGIEMLAGWLLTDCTGNLNEACQEKLTLMNERVKRMHNLIEGILRYAHIGRTTGGKEKIDLNKVIPEIMDLMAPPAHIHFQIETKLPTVFAERAPVEQLFQNLLSNAVKYIDKPEGLIRIGATETDGFWEFYINDNGPGIEEEYFPRIFQLFQTLQARDQFESTGIGLTIVKKIVENFGGKVWLESTLGEGTTFYFTLPQEVMEKAPVPGQVG